MCADYTALIRERDVGVDSKFSVWSALWTLTFGFPWHVCPLFLPVRRYMSLNHSSHVTKTFKVPYNTLHHECSLCRSHGLCRLHCDQICDIFPQTGNTFQLSCLFFFLRYEEIFCICVYNVPHKKSTNRKDAGERTSADSPYKNPFVNKVWLISLSFSVRRVELASSVSVIVFPEWSGTSVYFQTVLCLAHSIANYMAMWPRDILKVSISSKRSQGCWELLGDRNPAAHGLAHGTSEIESTVQAEAKFHTAGPSLASQRCEIDRQVVTPLRR